MTDTTLTRVPLDLQLADPEGRPVTFGEALIADLTVVQLVRYFGCLPCQEWLVELDRAVPGLGAGDWQSAVPRTTRPSGCVTSAT